MRIFRTLFQGFVWVVLLPFSILVSPTKDAQGLGGVTKITLDKYNQKPYKKSATCDLKEVKACTQ